MNRFLANHPSRVLAGVVFFAVGALIWWIWSANDSYRLIEKTKTQSMRIVQLNGEIMRLDEVLTMSCRMAAATRDEAWERRYREGEVRLDAAIGDLKKLAEDLKVTSVASTDEANIKLVEMENRAFGLVREKRFEVASAILFSKDYETQKQVYGTGMSDLTETMRLGLEQGLASEQLKVRRSIILAGGLIGLLLFALAVVIRSFQRRRQSLLLELLASKKAGRELQIMRVDLEARVEQSQAELRRREQQLIQAQKMESIGRLAGGVAHDFNNMLCAINGFTEMARELVHAGDPVSEYLDEIRKAGDRAAGLTQQLLAFSRKQVLRPRILHLNTVIAEMQAMLKRLIGEEILLSTRFRDPMDSVKADPGQLQQVIMNLVVNARDAMPRGGSLTLTTDQVRFDGVVDAHIPAGDYAIMKVVDTGTGMDAATQQRLFEPFFTTKARGRGTGLGLSTAYGIIKQSGGYIWVTSEPGKGTTFTIALPAVRAYGTEASVAAPLQAPSKGERILVTEDESMVRALACQALRRNGYTVFEAVNGRDAMDFLAENGRIDLLLTDIMMPEMGGGELAKQARIQNPDLKILLMSGYTDDEWIKERVQDQELPLISKPFTLDNLAARVREVLDGVVAVG